MELFHKLYKTKSIVVISNINQSTEWKLDKRLKSKENFESTEIGVLEPFLLKNKEDYKN